MLHPGEDLVAKSFGGRSLGLGTVDVEAEPEDLGKGLFDGVVELQAAPVVVLVEAANHDGVALVRRDSLVAGAREAIVIWCECTVSSLR